MRNTLINIAAWTAAVCVVLWQRFFWPGLQRFLPGIDELVRTIATDVRTNAVQTEPAPEPKPLPEVETLVIQLSEPKAAPRRRSATAKAKPATPRTRKPKAKAPAGFAS